MNVAHRLERLAQSQSDVIAVAQPTKKYVNPRKFDNSANKGCELRAASCEKFSLKAMPSGRVYQTITFRELKPANYQ